MDVVDRDGDGRVVGDVGVGLAVVLAVVVVVVGVGMACPCWPMVSTSFPSS